MISNDDIHLLQEGIIKYLNIVQYASWNILRKNINSLYLSFSNCETIADETNLEYKVLYPLLRCGILETARCLETDKLVYCLGPEILIETEDNRVIEIIPPKNICRITEKLESEKHLNNKINMNNSLNLLKSIPSLYAVITHWQKSETEVHYIYDKFNKNPFLTARDTSLPNIYTSRDKVYSNRYIRVNDGTLYRIPEIEDNIDGINIALCYLEVIKGYSLFIFNQNKKELNCRIFSTMLPFLICRALILCDSMILIDERTHSNRPISIQNVTVNHISELKRIFGEKSVEEING